MAVHPPALVSVALSQHRTLDRITARCTAHPSYLYLTKAGWGWSQLEQGHHQRKANGESGTSVIKAGRQAVAVSRLPPACRSITRGSPAFSHSQRYKSEPAHPPSQDLLRSPTSLPIATPPPPSSPFRSSSYHPRYVLYSPLFSSSCPRSVTHHVYRRRSFRDVC